MLSEYLTQIAPASCWKEAMPGIRVGIFTGEERNFIPQYLQVRQEPYQFDVLFCQGGCLEITRRGISFSVENRDILLLCDGRAISSARVAEPLRGVLVQIDSRRIGPTAGILRSILGDWDSCIRHVHDHMVHHQGCKRIHATPWNQAVFSALDSMEPECQGPYCVLKTAEILYLLYSSPVFKSAGVPGGYVSKTIEDVRKYMENHLDEKLTITAMSHRFHISPTALKSGFRQLYGTPIHHWLQNHRMNHAAGLLRDTPMTVLQVAQTVGYEGLSQFNITFKQQFGMTPVQYKKMSNSIKF